jgi:hypothetical protein
LAASAGAYFIGGVAQTSSIAYAAGLTIQLCSGAYWPCVGVLRGRFLLPETRGVSVCLTRYNADIPCAVESLFTPLAHPHTHRLLSLLIVIPVLTYFYNDTFTVFLVCSSLSALSLYTYYLLTQVIYALLPFPTYSFAALDRLNQNLKVWSKMMRMNSDE